MPRNGFIELCPCRKGVFKHFVLSSAEALAKTPRADWSSTNEAQLQTFHMLPIENLQLAIFNGA
jgi:hypothetical protein